jgi:hypothetical protein
MAVGVNVVYLVKAVGVRRGGPQNPQTILTLALISVTSALL